MEQTNNELAVINSTDTLQAVTAAEIDQQIATAHRYPRDVNRSLQVMNTLALIDEETAESCFYHLERKGRDGSMSIIEGPSVRLAEIAATAWGNIRIATRVVGNDGKMVTVEAVAHDLESNVASSQQQVRSILNKYGQPFSNDMQVMTINAASSVARRNAIYNVVPKAFINKVVEQCKEYIKGQATMGLRDSIQKVVRAFSKYGVTAEMVCEKMEVKTLNDITPDMVVRLTGIGTAIKDKQTTVEEEFPQLIKTQPTINDDAKPMSAADKAREILEKRNAEKAAAEQPTAPQAPDNGQMQPNLNFDGTAGMQEYYDEKHRNGDNYTGD